MKVEGEWKAIDRKGEFVKDSSDISQQGEGKAEPLSGRRLFKLVEDLVKQRPFTPEDVARLTGCHLHPDPASSNVHFTVLKSGQDPQKTLVEVELRVPTKMSGKKDGLLIVSVNPSPCINAKEVLFHFGREPEVHAEPPEPGGFYYQYRFPWGDLRFAIGAGEPACLRVVAIDAIAPKGPGER